MKNVEKLCIQAVLSPYMMPEMILVKICKKKANLIHKCAWVTGQLPDITLSPPVPRRIEKVSKSDHNYERTSEQVEKSTVPVEIFL